jgi:hypothetical protein
VEDLFEGGGSEDGQLGEIQEAVHHTVVEAVGVQAEQGFHPVQKKI